MYLSVSYLPFFLLCLNLKVELLSATNFYQNLSPRSGNIKYVSDGFSHQQAVLGSRVLLACNSSSWSPDVTLVIWYKGITGSPLYTLDARGSSSLLVTEETEARISIDRSTKLPSLVIDPVLEEDLGEYRCRVDFRKTRTKNFVVRMDIIVPTKEVIIMDGEGQRLEKMAGPYDEGSDSVLLCEAVGTPAPTVTWWSEGLLLDDSFFVAPHGFSRNELKLFNVNRSNLMSELVCRASNNNLTVPVEGSVFIDLNLRPLEVRITTPRTPLVAGHRVEFRCQTTGSRPAPRISWLKSTLKLLDVQDTYSTDGNLTLSTLSLVPDVVDSGKHITCRADNPALEGSALEDSTKLVVHYVPQLTLALGANINRDTIKEGTDVYLECHVRANPWVYEVTWLFEGHALSSDHAKGVIIANQSLVLQKVKRNFRGKYQCVGRNKLGLGKSNPLFLRVQFAPTCKPDMKTHYTVARGEQAHILCEVDADPSNVSFKWFLNNSSETMEIRSFSANGSRSVASYSPRTRFGYGSLFCWAENYERMSSPCQFHIIPAGPPQSVRSCLIANHSMTTLLLDCMPGDDGGLQQIFYVEVFNTLLQEYQANLSSLERPNFLIENLSPGTKFNLIIYSANTRGRSTQLTLSAATLGPPERQTSPSSISGALGPGAHMYIWILSACALLLVVIIVIVILVKVFAKRNTSVKGNPAIKVDEMDRDKGNSSNSGFGGRSDSNVVSLKLINDNSSMGSKCDVITSATDEGFINYSLTSSIPWEAAENEGIYVSKNRYSTSSTVIYQPTTVFDDGSMAFAADQYQLEASAGEPPDCIVTFSQPARYLSVEQHLQQQHHNQSASSLGQTQHHVAQQHHLQQGAMGSLVGPAVTASTHSHRVAAQLGAFHRKVPLRESPIADGCSESEAAELSLFPKPP